MHSAYLPKPRVALRYGKSTRTIDNWLDRPEMNFPRPIVINGREHFPVDGPNGLDEWNRSRQTPSISKAA